MTLSFLQAEMSMGTLCKVGDVARSRPDDDAEVVRRVIEPRGWRRRPFRGQGHVLDHVRRGNLEFDEVQTTSKGEIKADTNGGDIRMTRCKSIISASSQNGNFQLVDGDGNISATTANGNIELRDCDGNLAAITKNGKVVAENCTGNLITSSAKVQRE